MQLSAAVFLLGLASVLVVADHSFDYPGLAAFGGMLTAFIGVRISRTGLTQLTNDGTEVAINFGDIDVGILIMLMGAIILIQRMNKFRKGAVR